MDAALRSARHDARLLGNHLKRSLGKGNEPLPESAARAITTSLLAREATHGDLDMDRALRLSRLAPPCATARSIAQDATGTAMDVEGDGGTDAAVGSIGADTLPSGPGGQADSPRAAPSHDMVGVTDEPHHVAEMGTTLQGGKSPGSADSSVVDRTRLIAILAAEERISAMANHLGSADPMSHLRASLLPEQEYSVPSFFWSATEAPTGDRSHLRDMIESSSMGLCESSAVDEVPANNQATTNHPSEKGPGALPHLSLDSQPSRGQGKPAQRKQRRSRSAEDAVLFSSKSEPWDDSFVGETNHGRKKRSRESEVAGHGEETPGLGRARSSRDDFSRPGLVRSSSLSSNQPQHMTAPEASVTTTSSFCSLPKLKTSRLNW